MSEIQRIDLEKLRQVEDKTGFNTNHIYRAITEAKDLYSILPLDPLETAPITSLKQLSDINHRFLEILRSASTFDAMPVNTASSRAHSLLLEIDHLHASAFSIISSIIGVLLAFSIDLDGIELHLRDQAAAVDKRILETEAANAVRIAQIESDAGKLRRLAEEAITNATLFGVSKQGAHFSAEAEAHRKDATRWLWAVGGFSTILLCYAYWTLDLHKNPQFSPLNTYETVQLAISKVLVFTTIASALFLSVRNYAASRHNAVVNRHRYNALSTFHALVEAGSEPAKRDIVLEKAASCIFTPQPTGFNKTDGGEGSPISIVSMTSGAAKSAMNG